ncbi:protein C19orf12-like isoform X2 [Adelges cooleyi]|uniref:protein C19orf12-like isoform X2 n=1 Tax=Adelges cooleyi TaxID=133065 RepID=UPI00217F6353|nr:protein C19orf12-like isoform X2 [Adelges cooleyi]XP_050430586.1 protein C19orf12-like isoform X2 [Adelges cooleyi]XP_050430587.1 protein C19orf12-like isoform X2 [Adelges cooleyi]
MSLLMPSREITRVLNVIGELFQEEGIQICVKESFKGGLITGISTIIGGLLGGKTGLLAGGLVGTVAAVSMAPNYKSLLEVIHELDYETQRKMFDAIQNAVQSVDLKDVVNLTITLAASQSIKQIVIRETMNFIQNELQMAIASS